MVGKLDRRAALRLGAAAFAASPWSAAQTGTTVALPQAGRLKPRAAVAISASPLSVGFETLDRKMFEPEKTYGALAQLGVKWARCQTGWARTEQRKGEYDFRWLDEVVDALLKIGVQPWFNLGYGNRLYSPEAPHETAVGYVPTSPEARKAWVAYVGRIAGHFRTRVKHWEIWNEPNIVNFWRPGKPDGKAYAEFVALTAPVIRKRVPGAVIVGFALANLGAGLDYVKTALDAGIARHIDRFSYHPYQVIPEANCADQVRAVRSLLGRYKPGIPLWQGENGAPSQISGAGHVFEVDGTEAGQAKWLLRRILTDLSLDVELTSYFHCTDLAKYIWSDGPSGQTQRMGLLRAGDYTPKTSYTAYQSLCALFDARTKRVDAPALFNRIQPDAQKRAVAIDGIWRAMFRRENRPVLAYWRPDYLGDPARAEEVNVSLWPEAELPSPVLVDPLTTQVYELKANRRGGWYDIRRVPLFGYPLIVTDRSVV
jgi:polysaccharide biosynthesis protein PslG